MHCTPAITKVVNLSLNIGDFYEEWKLAIVRPLMKAVKGELKNLIIDQ